jgi:hypothetical protein
MANNVTTGKVRLSYLNVFKATAFDGTNNPKYRATILIPKSDTKTLEKIRAAIQAAKDEGKSTKWGGKVPSNLWDPLRDGDEKADEDHPEYKGMYFLSAKRDPSQGRPTLVDTDGTDLLDETELYSGCWARANLSFFAYSNTTKGVGVSLEGLRKVKDDKKFGGGMTSTQVKSAFDDDFDYDAEADTSDLDDLMG